MDETGLGSCPVAGFVVSGVEPLCSVATVSYIVKYSPYWNLF
jgi:hypothetical protein